MSNSRVNLAKDKANASLKSLVVGIDTGGTFTDVVYRWGSERGRHKLLSTPDDPGRAVVDALLHLFGDQRPQRITYGSTVATNAMLERRGARTALLTTAGFEDVIEIGRQARSQLYDLEPVKPELLVPQKGRLGLGERVLFDGSVAQAPTAEAIAKLRSTLRRQRIESIAVCLLHAHVNGAHERLMADALGDLGIPISLSHLLSPEAGEYERTNTTVANAYVRPLMASHLSHLASETGAQVFRVMQSNGGAIGVDIARREPIRTMLSGPAGGVAAALTLIKDSGINRAITLDMGGTSTDVALLDGDLPRCSVTTVAGVPVLTPCIDIHTVGAGGGSIAWLDAGGSLKVGPLSAGADPGPACYGRGKDATVTDANLVVGRLRPQAFLGGSMGLDQARAQQALDRLASKLGAASAEEAAEGVLSVVEATMERAIRVITIERGQDPRSCALVAFGGAAGLHACGLAEELGIGKILVPTDPGVFSAWGVIDGPVTRDHSQAYKCEQPVFADLSERAARLRRRATADIITEGTAKTRLRAKAFVKIRYLGQALELEVPLTRNFRRVFDDEHQRLLHTCDRSRPIEVTTVRVTVVASDAASARPNRGRGSRQRGVYTPEKARVYIGGRFRSVAVYARDSLVPDQIIKGPAIVTEYSSTVLVAANWRLGVGKRRALQLSRNG